MKHVPQIPRRGDEPQYIPPPPVREPMFTMPTSVIVMVAVLALIHAGRGLLTDQADFSVLVWFAFIPARYSGEWMLPGGIAADVWTFVTYALLHGSTMHIITNAVWLLAFGSAVARRFGALRFWVFSAAAAAAGAAMHLAFNWGDTVPVVGASAAIAGQMAAAVRFVFDRDGPLVFRRGIDERRYRRPARSLLATLSNRSALAFVVIFFLVNLVAGFGNSMAGGAAIAWQAHVGGFLFGLFAFRLFDPVPR